ncbi:hypothetical protein HYV30_03255 [Candidatus Kaiserbacteria bacterium]|nr:hypothetical protein [Candidatus Kaiserbacteria bacterium]
MSKKVKQALIIAAGILFIVAGIAGLALPFLQGFFFIFIGALLLSTYSVTIRGWIDRHVQRYPPLKAVVDKAEAWVARIIGEP